MSTEALDLVLLSGRRALYLRWRYTGKECWSEYKWACRHE